MKSTKQIIENIYRVCMFAELPECANNTSIEVRGKFIQKMIDINLNDVYSMSDEELITEFYRFVESMAEEAFCTMYNID